MLSTRMLFVFVFCAAVAFAAEEEKHEKASGTATAPEVDAAQDGNATAPALGLSEEKLNKLAVPSLLKLHESLNLTDLQFLADKFDECKKGAAKILSDDENEKCIEGFAKEQPELAKTVRDTIVDRKSNEAKMSEAAKQFFTNYREINAEVRPIYRKDRAEAIKTLISNVVAKWDALPEADKKSFAAVYADIATALGDKETREFGTLKPKA